MELTVPINYMLKDEITKVDHTLIPPGCQGDVRKVRIIQKSLSKLIDSLGLQSAEAQKLSRPITTADKLAQSKNHVLYILKDAAGNNGDGEVVGYLKVAPKHLYMFDEANRVCEVDPLCVLDFYVCSDRQRRGNGKKLFDYMLQDTGCLPKCLAVDGPSPKMEQFLATKYGVNPLTCQSNNFAVSPAFFPASSGSAEPSRNPAPARRSPIGRYAAKKPSCSIADIIHGSSERVHGKTTNGTFNN